MYHLLTLMTWCHFMKSPNFRITSFKSGPPCLPRPAVVRAGRYDVSRAGGGGGHGAAAEGGKAGVAQHPGSSTSHTAVCRDIPNLFRRIHRSADLLQFSSAWPNMVRIVSSFAHTFFCVLAWWRKKWRENRSALRTEHGTAVRTCGPTLYSAQAVRMLTSITKRQRNLKSGWLFEPRLTSPNSTLDVEWLGPRYQYVGHYQTMPAVGGSKADPAAPPCNNSHLLSGPGIN